MSLLSAFPSSSFLVKSFLGNSAKLAMDRKGWDTVYRTALALAEQRGLVPKGTAGTWSVVGVLFLAGALLEWNLGQETLAAGIMKEVLTDGPSELSSRLLEDSRGHPAPESVPAGPDPALADPTLTRSLITWLAGQPEAERHALTARIRHLKTTELALLVQLRDTERDAYLDLIAPHRIPAGRAVARAIDSFTNMLWPTAGHLEESRG